MTFKRNKPYKCPHKVGDIVAHNLPRFLGTTGKIVRIMPVGGDWDRIELEILTVDGLGVDTHKQNKIWIDPWYYWDLMEEESYTDNTEEIFCSRCKWTIVSAVGDFCKWCKP